MHEVLVKTIWVHTNPNAKKDFKRHAICRLYYNLTHRRRCKTLRDLQLFVSYYKIATMKICVILLMLLGTKTLAQQTSLVSQANLFLSTLSEPLRAKAQYDTNNEERLNWHFVPRERNGVSFREFNGQQRDAALGLLKLSLSQQGYQKTMEIIALENVLRQVENRGPDDKYRDPLNYYFTIFGKPAVDKPLGLAI